MIVWITLLLLKILIALIVFSVAFLAWKHFKAMRRCNFYRNQGIFVAQGAGNFFLGNFIDLADWEK